MLQHIDNVTEPAFMQQHQKYPVLGKFSLARAQLHRQRSEQATLNTIHQPAMQRTLVFRPNAYQ